MTTPKAVWTPAEPISGDVIAAVVAAIEADPQLAARIHAAADLDGSPLAAHHTLGGGAVQAAAGNHQHPESTPDRLQLVSHEEEFLAARSANEEYAWLVTEISGTAAASNAFAGEPGRPGIVRLSTGTTATGSAGHRTNSTALAMSEVEVRCDWIVRFETLSDGTNTYVARAGFIDVGGGAPLATPTNGAFFEYASAATGNWRIRTAFSGSLNTIVTAVPVVAGQWYHLAVKVTPDALRADFLIDGLLVGSSTSFIPNGVGAETGCGATLSKTVGLTARTMDIDYARLEISSATITR